jgi:macrolide transport system ATP-binding/permease protein
MSPSHLIEEFFQDLRYGARMLKASPGFTLAAMASLGIGIGVTTVLFTNLQSTIFRDIPGVADSGGLVRTQSPVAYSSFENFRDHSGQFESLTGYIGPVPFVLANAGSRSERIWGHVATPEYFSVLRVQPLAGRLFGEEEKRPGGPGVAVISATLAGRKFGTPSAAVGRTMHVNGQTITVIGVSAEKFAGAAPFLASADIWIPTTSAPQVAPELGRLQDRTPAFDLTGRLRPGVTNSQAEAALESIARRLEQVHNDPGKDRHERRIRLLPGGRMFPVRDEEMPAALGLPIVLGSLVLLMACGNVANMLIARGTARSREIAVRLAIGASRSRLVRQMVTESSLLALLGGLAGLVFARQAMSFYDSLRPMLPSHIYFDFSFNWRAMATTAVVSLLAAVAVGLMPALQSTGVDVFAAIKSSTSTRIGPWRWLNLRNLVITNQVMVSMVLLLLTGFIVVGFSRSSSLNLGFDTSHLYLMSLDPVRDGLDAAAAARKVELLQRRLEGMQGVRSVSLAQSLPIAFTSGESITAAKMEAVGGAQAVGSVRSDRVGDNFFETTGIAILRGRGFIRSDVAGNRRTMVVNETMAQRLWPGQDPVGQQIDFGGQAHEIIGVAADIRPAMPMGAGRPAAYQPVRPSDYTVPSRYGITVLIRVQPGFDAATRLRDEVEQFDPRLTVFNLRSMEDIAREALFFAHLAVNVYGAMGIFAMVLACTGLAGVTAYSVARRAREIGIRKALGAPDRHVYRLVLTESAYMIGIGGMLGLGLALGTMRALSSIMNVLAEATKTSTSDPVLVIGAPLLLVSIALLVCYIPARKVARIDPASSLRSE